MIIKFAKNLNMKTMKKKIKKNWWKKYKKIL